METTLFLQCRNGVFLSKMYRLSLYRDRRYIFDKKTPFLHCKNSVVSMVPNGENARCA